MKKIFSFIIESIFWLQLFFAPVFLGVLVAFFIYISNEKLLWLSITIFSISVILGVIYAERIRKKYGTSRYLSKRLSTPDIWSDEYPEEIEANKKEFQKKGKKNKVNELSSIQLENGSIRSYAAGENKIKGRLSPL